MKSLVWVALAGFVALGGCTSTQKVEQVPAGPGPSRASYSDSVLPAGGTPNYGSPGYATTPAGGSVTPGTPGMGSTDTGTGTDLAPLAPVAPDKTAKVAAVKPAKSTKTATVATKTATTYVVKKGDTLSGIAKKVYGDAKQWKKIAKANAISDPNLIKIGQTLKIP